MSEQDQSLAPPNHSQELTDAEKENRAKELSDALSDLKTAKAYFNEIAALRTQLAEARKAANALDGIKDILGRWNEDAGDNSDDVVYEIEALLFRAITDKEQEGGKR